MGGSDPGAPPITDVTSLALLGVGRAWLLILLGKYITETVMHGR